MYRRLLAGFDDCGQPLSVYLRQAVGQQPHADPLAAVVRMGAQQAQVIVRFSPRVRGLEPADQLQVIGCARAELGGGQPGQAFFLRGAHLGATRRDPDGRGRPVAGQPGVRVARNAPATNSRQNAAWCAVLPSGRISACDHSGSCTKASVMIEVTRPMSAAAARRTGNSLITRGSYYRFCRMNHRCAWRPTPWSRPVRHAQLLRKRVGSFSFVVSMSWFLTSSVMIRPNLCARR
jgi:hypothetical protein